MNLERAISIHGNQRESPLLSLVGMRPTYAFDRFGIESSEVLALCSSISPRLYVPDMNPKSIRLSFATLLAALVTLGTAAPAQAQLGVSAGLNFDSVGDIETSTNTQATLDNSTGYHVGAVYDLGLGPINVRPGLFYRKLGQTYEFPSSVLNDGASADVAAWEVPVDVRVTLLPTPVVSPYLLGGPKASFLQSDLDELDDELEEVSYSFVIGLGANISLGPLFTLQPELRYDFGATDYISESFEVGGTEFTQEDPTLSAFALRLNVIF